MLAAEGMRRVLLASSLLFLATAGAAVPQPTFRFLGSLLNADGPYHLTGAHGIALSPDNEHVYVATFTDHAVVVLDRSASTGLPTYVEAQIDQQGGVTGIMSASAVTVSPDGADVYVVGYFGNGLAAFHRNADTGRLEFLQSLIGADFGLMGPNAIAGSADGKHLYVSSFIEDGVSVFARAADGRVGYLETERDGVGGVVGLFKPTSVTVTPDDSQVLALSGSDNSLVVFGRNKDSGLLTYQQTVQDGVDGVTGLLGAIDVAVTPDGTSVYAIGEGALVTFTRNTSTGLVTFVSARFDVAGPEEQGSPSALTISADGQRVLMTRAGDDTLVVFGRDQTSGALTTQQTFQEGIAGVRGLEGANDVVLTSDGRYAYVAAQFSDAVTTFGPPSACAGDCNGDGEVTIDEIIVAVNISLGSQAVGSCIAVDFDGSGEVTVDELIRAVRASLEGCG